jgi:hypothetical protein
MFGMQTASDVRKLMVQQIRRKGPTLLKWLQTWSLASLNFGRILDLENTGTRVFQHYPWVEEIDRRYPQLKAYRADYSPTRWSPRRLTKPAPIGPSSHLVLPTATEVETEWHQPGPNHGLADRCFAPVLVVPGRRAQSEIGHLAPLLVAPLTGNVTRGCKAPASAAPSPLVPAGC